MKSAGLEARDLSVRLLRPPWAGGGARDPGLSIFESYVSLFLSHPFGFPAEMIQQRLEALEKERSSLHFQLPSQQPALSGLLGHLGAQAQASCAGQLSGKRSRGPLPSPHSRVRKNRSRSQAQETLASVGWAGVGWSGVPSRGRDLCGSCLEKPF